MSRNSSESSPIAYSYIRFSSREQAKGDSLRRQTEATEEWCKKNGVALDTSTTLHDLGKSAFTGEHRKNPDRHGLAAFLKLVEQGRVPRGSFLILENLDRLSREHIQPALLLALNLLQAGIRIVQLKPVEMIFDDKSDTMPVMMMMMELSRGHGESRMKSERLGPIWREKKRRAREDGETLTGSLPGWIENRGGKRHVKPEAAAAIKRLFQLAARGYGHIRIIHRLTEEGLKPFGCSHRKQHKKPPRWTKTYIFDLLKDRRLLGEFQPRFKVKGKAKGPPDGEIIENYFPAVLTEAEFYAAQRGRDDRKSVRRDATPIELQAIGQLNRDGNSVAEISRKLGIGRQSIYRALIKLGQTPNRAGETPDEKKEREKRERGQKDRGQQPRPVYLFAGMVGEYWKDRRFGLATWQSGGRHLKILFSEESKQSFPYFVLERALLHELQEIDPKEILEGANGHNEVVSLDGEYGAVDAEIQQINADMEANGFSATLGKRVRQLESRLAEIAGQLAAARQKAANPLSGAWGEAKTLLSALDSAADQEDARVRLRAALRRIIAAIRMVVIKGGREKIALIDVEFSGEHANRSRSYTVWYRPQMANKHKRIPGAWAVASATGQGKPIDFVPSDEPGEPPLAYPSEWIQSVPVEPKDWFPLPE
jgi:DNA invertase Pin-like site-specific DNA recombinase